MILPVVSGLLIGMGVGLAAMVATIVVATSIALKGDDS